MNLRRKTNPKIQECTLSVLFLAVAVVCSGQQNPAWTNTVTSPKNIREVNGKVYDVMRSTNFVVIQGKCLEVRASEIKAQEIRPIYDDSGLNDAQKQRLGRKKVGDSAGPVVIIRNHSARKGQSFTCRATHVGEVTEGDKKLPVYDCGIVHQTVTVTTNPPARPPNKP